MLEDYLKQKLPFGAMKHWGFVHGKIIELNRQRIFQQTMVDDQKWSWKPLQNDVNILEKKSPMNLGFGNYEKYEYRNCQLISAFFKGIMIITLIYFDVNWCHLCNGYNGIDHGRANNTGSFDHLSQCIQTNSNPLGYATLSVWRQFSHQKSQEIEGIVKLSGIKHMDDPGEIHILNLNNN